MLAPTATPFRKVPEAADPSRTPAHDKAVLELRFEKLNTNPSILYFSYFTVLVQVRFSFTILPSG
jgi:hypothetical protein